MANLKDKYQKRFGIKSTLRGYQLKAANLGTRLDNYALLMDPRLGKTRIAVAVAGYRRIQSHIQRWVIICPVIAMEVWRKEIELTLSLPYKLQIIEGKGPERKLLLQGWRDDPGKLSIIILNFEATWRWKKWLYKLNPDKIDIDESHRIKKHSSRQSGTCHNLSKRADYRCILTGTFMSSPSDVFSQYKFLDPTVFGTVWKENVRKPQPSFLGRYVKTWGYGGYNPKTFHRLDELQEKVQSRAFILTRAQAGGFPQEQYQNFAFDLTSPALGHYREMKRELRTMVNGSRVSAEIILTQILRLQQITGGFLPVKKPDEDLATNVPLGEDRLRALEALLEEYPLEEPIVIFAKFRYEVSAILELVRKRGRVGDCIIGGGKDRGKVIEDFQGSKTNTCVVQIRAGGISVDLSRANNCIFYSVTHYLEYEQAKARIIARTGGKKSFLRLAARGTIDEQLLEALDTRESLVKKILYSGPESV